MPTTKATSKKATPKAKMIGISFQKPGELPETLKVKADSTAAELASTLNLDGYVFSVNGKEVKDMSLKLQKDDVVRVGIKTKNN